MKKCLSDFVSVRPKAAGYRLQKYEPTADSQQLTFKERDSGFGIRASGRIQRKVEGHPRHLILSRGGTRKIKETVIIGGKARLPPTLRVLAMTQDAVRKQN